MPATKRPKPLYQRGSFKLYPARPGRTNLEIVHYDAAARRERGSSAGTSDYGQAELELDRRYLRAEGSRVCEACGRPHDGEQAPPLSRAITDYIISKEGTAGFKATRGRLGHVIDYIAENDPHVTVPAVDERWVNGFRAWLSAKPVVGNGPERARSLGHVEGCVMQLAAAINATPGQQAQFRNEQPKTVARSPAYRADVKMLAAMFRYCLKADAGTAKERAQQLKDRANLLAYLRIAVATWARPEEIFDVGEGQWEPSARVLDLNPAGRRQTRKYRTRVPIAHQFAPYLDEMKGRYLQVASVRSTWAKMREAVGLPSKRGEAGEKLIRRSMATLVRRRIGEANWRQGEMMLGHVKQSVSDIYALPDPANLGLALAATEAIIDEIESHAPGAFYRDVTARVHRLALAK